RCFLLGLVPGNVHLARNRHLERIEAAAARLDLGAELRDACANRLDRRELVEDEIAAALGREVYRGCAAGCHPERWMGFLAGRRLDDDVLVSPEAAVMGEAPVRRPRRPDDLERLGEPRVGFLDRNAEAGEFVVAITLADAEIEPAVRQQIERRG